MREALRHPLTHLRAGAAACRAAWLLVRSRALPFDRMVVQLRRGTPFRGRLADPVVHRRVVSRLLPYLPPRRMGGCLKRSLILLHLWSRCDLEPRLHLGFVKRPEDAWHAHAWLTAEDGENRLAAGSSEGYDEAFLF